MLERLFGLFSELTEEQNKHSVYPPLTRHLQTLSVRMAANQIPYRIFKAVFPFEARDGTEMTIAVNQILVVYMKDDGTWPVPEGWMKGKDL